MDEKILYIHHSSAMGGGTLSCYDVTEMLQDNQNVVVSLPLGSHPARLYGEKINIPLVTGTPNTCVFRYYSGGPVFWKVIGSYLLSYKNMKKWRAFLKHDHYDLILLNSIVLWPMLKVFKSEGIKTGMFIRETMRGKPDSIMNRYIRYNLNRYASGVSFLSEYDRNTWNLCDSCVQTIVPDAVKETEFSVNLSPSGPEYLFEDDGDQIVKVLYVGGMNRLKGAITIVKAMQYCSEDVHLYMLGDPMRHTQNKKHWRKKDRYAANVYEEIKKLNLEKRVHVIGTSTNMPFWYSNCDFCVIPIEEPHQSRSIYEAGLFDKPVVATRFNNYAEYLFENESGLMFEKGNVKELASQMNALARDRSLRVQLGKRNHELAMEQHSYTGAKHSVTLWVDRLEKL